MKTITYQLDTLTCPSCTAKIEGALKKTKGVEKYDVLFNSSRVKVTLDENIVQSEEIVSKIDSLGFSVLSEK
jgi:copper chaperone CopZ